MKLVLFITCCAAVCGTAFSFDEWVSFKAKYGKAYSGENEEHLRLGIYLSNKQRIEEHNAKYEAGLVSFKMEMNHFGDKLQDEISSLNGLNITGELETQEPKLFYSRSYDDAELPSSVDWREKGAVTHVKNQGRCGSCWAFSTTGSLEGQLFKKSGELVALSEQNLVDCASNNNGCHGGLMSLAFEFIKENDGIQSEDSYPYEGYKGACRFRNSEVAATVRGYVSVHADEEALKEAVATIGPISVAINAGQSSFSFYRQGVYDDMSCDPKNLNHGVLLVGYGTEDGQDYWLIKNSWGTAWGEGGYVKIARNQNNLCGVASMAGYPLV